MIASFFINRIFDCNNYYENNLYQITTQAVQFLHFLTFIFYLKGGSNREWEGHTEVEFIHSLVCYPNIHNGHGWVRTKSEASSSSESSISLQGPKDLIFPCLPRQVRRDLDGKWSNWKWRLELAVVRHDPTAASLYLCLFDLCGR